MQEILFEESQRVGKFWRKILYIIVLIISMFFIHGVIRQLYFDIPFGDEPLSDKGLLLTVMLAGLIISLTSALILKINLITIVKRDGLYFKYFPFHLKFKYYSKEQLKSFEVRKYNPILEYGGWGIRLGIFSRRGTAYNLTGNIGLQFTTMDDKKILIGTQKPNEIDAVMMQVFPHAIIKN
ncbi:MAG: hypothetical protein HW421_2398 [Ignavibacteria bacterium]|nr:hypothetical protein [Ignavibacteria bacterium]